MVQAMLAAGNQIIDYPYSWGGAHGNVKAMEIPPGPSVDPGAEENGGPGFDCSSAVGFLMWNAGLGVSLMGGADLHFRVSSRPPAFRARGIG